MKSVKLSFDKLLRNNGDFLDNVLNSIHNPTPKSAILPYTFYDKANQIFYLKDGTIGFGFQTKPIVGVDSNTSKQISLLFADQLPAGAALQVLLLASDNLDEVLKTWCNSRTVANDIYRKLEEWCIDYYKAYNKSTKINFKHRNYRLFFFCSFGVTKKQELLEFRETLRGILSSIQLFALNLSSAELLKLLAELINCPNYKDITYRENDLIGDQLTDLNQRLLVDENGIYHQGDADHVTRVYQVDSFPREFSIPEVTNLLGDDAQDTLQIPAKFGISYTVINNITSSIDAKLRNKGDMIIKQAKSMLAIFNDAIKEEAREWTAIQDELKKRERFLTSSFQVFISANKDQIAKAEASLVSLWRKNDVILKPSKWFHLPAFLSLLPFLQVSYLAKLMKHFNLSRSVLSSEANALLPINGEWSGSKSGMLLTGKKGQLFAWNSFEGGSNYNAAIIGESGSGKSVFLQSFVAAQLAAGARVFVIDIGKSFQKTCKLLDGDFVHFGAASKTSINPFCNIPDEKIDASDNVTNITEDALSLIKFTISKMVAPKAGTQDLQDAIISSAIFEGWSHYKQKLKIDHLAQILKNKGDEGKRLSTMLFEYTKKGSYGKFFSGENNIAFNKDLTVLEFEELRERPDLASVIMQMLAIQIMSQVYLSDRSRKFIILFDEAWYALLNFPKLLASMARTLRKYNGALVLGTQSLTDFYCNDNSISEDDKARASVIENCSWRVFLKQKADSAERGRKIGLNDNHIELIKNLEMVPKHFSEMLIFQSDSYYFVARLMLDPFFGTLSSSDPRIFSRVSRLIDKGMSVSDAVEQVTRGQDE